MADPLSVTCPTCHAPGGEKCRVTADDPTPSDKRRTRHLADPHPERLAAATPPITTGPTTVGPTAPPAGDVT